jgi:hypothetical protein
LQKLEDRLKHKTSSTSIAKTGPTSFCNQHCNQPETFNHQTNLLHVHAQVEILAYQRVGVGALAFYACNHGLLQAPNGEGAR